MDSDAPLITYELIGWDAAAEAHLGLIGRDTDAGMLHLKDEVQRGAVDLHAVLVDGARCGTIATSIESDFCGKVLFVCAMGAESMTGLSLSEHAANTFLPHLAQERGCAMIRFWTERAGFEPTMIRAGYRPVTVWEKQVPPPTSGMAIGCGMGM